jgi:SAM-dependent methyltransferase
MKYCHGSTVLDAGSGAGYGTAYLADHGAKNVVGVDLDMDSVVFSQDHFLLPNLKYRIMDVGVITGFSPGQFDLIFSSNTLEHVPNILGFFRKAQQLLNPIGTVIIAVPPITRDIDWTENIANPYHLNIWTPRQWYSVLGQFFEDVQPYWHGFTNNQVRLDFLNTPEQTVISEYDFEFQPIKVDDFYRRPTLTAIFLARSPRPEKDLPLEGLELKFVDQSFSRPSPLGGNILQANWFQYQFHRLKRYEWRSREIYSQEGAQGIWQRLMRKLKHNG